MKTCITGISGSRIAYYVSKQVKMYDKTLLIVSTEQAGQRLGEDLSFFVDIPIYVLPDEKMDRLYYEAHDNDSLIRRMKALCALSFPGKAIIIATASSCLKRVETADRFREGAFTLRLGDEIDPSELKRFLINTGYESAHLTEAPGMFSTRGGIIDVFPPCYDDPIRIEFFGDEIDSIRTFDADTQRSEKNLSEVVICPAFEFIPSDEEIKDASERLMNKQGMNSTTAFEFFDIKTSVQIFSDYIEYFDVQSYFFWDFAADCTKSMLESFCVIVDDPARIIEGVREYQNEEDFYSVYKSDNVVAITPFPETVKGMGDADRVITLKTRQIPAFNGSMDLLIGEIQGNVKKGYEVHIVAEEDKIEHLRSLILENPMTGGVIYDVGSLSAGMVIEDDKLCYISEYDIVPGRRSKSKKRKKKRAGYIQFSDLHPGDYVVHEAYGIGRFEKITTETVLGETKDYIKINYADVDMFLPVDQMDVIQKYIGNEGKAPKLSKVDGTAWKNTKARTRKAIMEVAEDLVELYAKRESSQGYAFSEDTVWQAEFEAAFPYEETGDQLNSIEEIKADMEKPYPMDRLLCGDVGYGKTEVAARAIFKCLAEGKQAVMLAPTTLLVNQHYYTFRERFEDYPFNIDMLCRFRTEQEQKKIIEGLKNGTIDFVIGTHRLLSDDVDFKDLGLLVIDEEQRFGVKSKEKIKMLKNNIDVLTLSATPIPRTLNMSLTGIKDISMIEEPPESRYPVQTYVSPQDEKLIQRVIERELARGGQVFVVYNNISGIMNVAGMLQRLVPEATIGIGHGRMEESKLEDVMLDFIEGRTDILLSTTIVENGIDIPNANTIIVFGSERLGLTQMYQLRGRVGRSDRIAYAYFMYNPDKVLTETAKKRLEAIKEFTEFGSGFKIAMKDLEIRGAGNVFGEAQHGHIESIGYELYCKEIDRAVKMLKGEAVIESRADISIELDVPARIPDTYIEDEGLRLQAYKTISQISSSNTADEVYDEFVDRYGDMPKITLNLIKISTIRALAEKLGIVKISYSGFSFEIEFAKKNNCSAYALAEAQAELGGDLIIRSGEVMKLLLASHGKIDLGKLIKLLDLLESASGESIYSSAN